MKRHWFKGSGPAYFITNTICEWKNIFIFQPYIQIVIRSWNHFQKNRAVEIFGFCIMPSHLHYIVNPTDENYTVTEMQRDFKKFTAKRILAGLKYEITHGIFPLVDIFKRNGVQRESAAEILRLFEMIGRYSRQQHKVWMSEEKPEAVVSADFFREKLEYIHLNPVRAGLVKEPVEYVFSSARNYYLGDDSFFRVTKPLVL